MSKINEQLNSEVIDNFKEHLLHKDYDKQCSTCFKDRLEKAELCGLSYTGDKDINGYPEFIGTQDQWEAFDILKFNICKSCTIPCANIYCDKCQYEIEQDPSYYD